MPQTAPWPLAVKWSAFILYRDLSGALYLWTGWTLQRRLPRPSGRIGTWHHCTCLRRRKHCAEASICQFQRQRNLQSYVTWSPGFALNGVPSCWFPRDRLEPSTTGKVVDFTVVFACNGAPVVVAGSKVAWRSVCMSVGAGGFGVIMWTHPAPTVEMASPWMRCPSAPESNLVPIPGHKPRFPV